MKKRFIPIWIVIAVVAVGGGYAYLRELGIVEKTYESKPASHWISALRDKDPKVSGKAMSALYELAPSSKEAARILLDIIKADPNPNVMENTPLGEASPNKAALALGQILQSLGPDAREFLPELISLLSDRGVFHRERACRLLGEMGSNSRDAVPALKKALSDEYSGVREEAAKALKQIDPEGRIRGN
jgi:HEAT repeat protein